MTGPKELALFTAAAAMALLSGAASGQHDWRLRGPRFLLANAIAPKRYPTTRYGAAEEEEGEARRRRREGIIEEAVDTGICPLSHLTP